MINYQKQVVPDFQSTLCLYEAVGWTNYTLSPNMLKAAIEHSCFIATAYDYEKLVGIVRAVGDEYSIMFVQDLIVLPEYQRQGIGRQLLKMVIDEYKEVYQLHLLTDNSEKNREFYQSMNFINVNDIQCNAYTYLKSNE